VLVSHTTFGFIVDGFFDGFQALADVVNSFRDIGFTSLKELFLDEWKDLPIGIYVLKVVKK